MRDHQRMRRALRAAHGAGAAGLLALAAALFASLPARAAGDTYAESVIDGRDLVRFAQLCEGTDGLDRATAVQVAAGDGFRNVDWIADEIEAFYAMRGAAFAHRGETNEILGDNPETVLGSFGHGWEAFFIGRDDTLLVMRSESVLALMNDVPVGEGHVCQFLGRGWIVEEDAEAALATVVGEDFNGRGRTIPLSVDWRNLFSGLERGPNPRGTFTITTVAGAPDGVPATFTFGYVVEHDMTVPPEVLEDR